MENEFEERLLSARTLRDDDTEVSLRPKTFEGYIGQEKVKENLKIFIEAAKQRGESLDHVLLYGPPGLGKTTLSNIIATEMGVSIRVTSGPALEKTGDLVALLTNLQDGDILFIDEIHRLSRTVEEVLYPAMEDFEFDIILGKGPSARSTRPAACAAARTFKCTFKGACFEVVPQVRLVMWPSGSQRSPCRAHRLA